MLSVIWWLVYSFYPYPVVLNCTRMLVIVCHLVVKRVLQGVPLLFQPKYQSPDAHAPRNPEDHLGILHPSPHRGPQLCVWSPLMNER